MQGNEISALSRLRNTSAGGMLDYLELLKNRIEGKELGVPDWMGEKRSIRPFARMIGVRTPKLFFEASLDDLPRMAFPDEFVIKPTFASTSIGVKLLKKTGTGKFQHLVSGEKVDIEEICNEFEAISERFLGEKRKGSYVVEQLLRDRSGNFPPRDIRLYAFQGEIGLIIAEDHFNGPARASYYDENFNLLEDVHELYGIDPKVEHLEKIVQEPAPENAERILAVARRISVSLPTEFCRIDLYDTAEGVVLGELTFYPGTFYYRNRKLMSEIESQRLGRIWQNSKAKLSGSDLLPAHPANL